MVERSGLDWLEEPLRADRPWSEWRALRAATSLALAAGENLAGLQAFGDALSASALSVVQPDAAKWGGVFGCWEVIGRVFEAGRTFCPHYLGAGIGLLASGHLLAACGGDGLLEVDANENPLRTMLWGPIGQVREGRVDLGETHGIGVEIELDALRQTFLGESAGNS